VQGDIEVPERRRKLLCAQELMQREWRGDRRANPLKKIFRVVGTT
jgi:hypothetical protein